MRELKTYYDKILVLLDGDKKRMYMSYNCEIYGKFQEYYLEEVVQEYQEFTAYKECFDKSLDD